MRANRNTHLAKIEDFEHDAIFHLHVDSMMHALFPDLEVEEEIENIIYYNLKN